MNQLSGRVAETPKGREINDLQQYPRQVYANSDTGQVGPWNKNPDFPHDR